MKDRIRSFFGSDTVFFWTTVLAFVFMIYDTALSAVIGELTDCVFNAVYAACVIGIYITFRNHEKSAAKYLIGMVMGMVIVGTVGDTILDFAGYWASEKYWCILSAIWALSAVLYAAVHLVLSLDHDSNPAFIFIAQACVAVNLIATILMCLNLLSDPEYGVLGALGYLGYIFLLGCIVCIDTKVDFFKAKRSANLL